jgi:hypothetical protein
MFLMAHIVMAADIVHARDVVECSERRGGDNAGYWSWRVIDGRICWYVGRPGKPKSELYWGRGPLAPSKTSVSAERPQDGIPQSNPVAVSVPQGEFDKTWNDLLSDMAMPFWRWRQPLSDQRPLEND